MGLNLVQKILKEHLISGEMQEGKEIGIRIDQTLTQDATGTMAWLQFEAIGIPKVKVPVAVSYVDHNTLQSGFENADDHAFLQSAAAKFGAYFSKPGNGICHQVNLERFGVPGRTLLGSDSHTPTGGGLGMIAMGAGGLDVAVAMGGGPYYLNMPKVVNVRLTGQLQPGVSAKDIILEVLRIMTVKGGVGKMIEYSGPGVSGLTVPERATITNMGAELGATTSVFPSDDSTRKFMNAQGRGADWRELKADDDANYNETIKINLDTLEPMIAQPHSPDNVVRVKEIEGKTVHQVCIGSCTNSSYLDLMTVAVLLKGKTVHPKVSLGISPGSKQVFEMIAREEALADIIASGARILESACGPCIGMGQSPSTDGVSLRTFNRNFPGRSGTMSAGVYLCSPEVAVASALTGVITDPRSLCSSVAIEEPARFLINDNALIAPDESKSDIELVKGPNIAGVPVGKPLADNLEGEVLLKVADNITTDHIMPAGAKILPLRSNIPKISEHVFVQVDPDFPTRAKQKGGGFILGGENYGQGSSREHAALAPMYLGVKAVITKSFARIHWNNLINFGILPLVLEDKAEYDRIDQSDKLEITGLNDMLDSDNDTLVISNATKGSTFKVKISVSGRQKDILKA